jgi:N-acetylglucosaminyldiphosphoundecaprenol N-acetyl-beta-D-mannosaminyltransferase
VRVDRREASVLDPGSGPGDEVRWIGPDAGLTHRCPPPRGGVLVNGVRIDPRTPDELLATLGSFIECGASHVVNFLAVDPIARTQGDRAYRTLLNKAELNLADGLPVAWAARSLGQTTARMPGTDSFQLVAEWGVRRDLGHYLYGGGTPADLEALVGQLEQRFSGIRIDGSESPPFRDLTDGDLDEAAGAARASGAEALWIGLGTPKQHVVGQQLRERGAAPIIFCVGAAFDFVSGTKSRAPDWMQRSGLEWVHRLASEPRRLWKRYLLGNPRFLAGYVAGRLAGTAVRSPSGGASPSGGEGR